MRGLLRRAVIAHAVALWCAAPGAAQVIAPSRSGAIIGTVTASHNGEPLVGARVALTAPKPGRQSETDAKGRFRFEGLLPGRYSVRAVMLGYEALDVDLDLEAGRTLELSFEPSYTGDTLPELVTRGRRAGDLPEDWYRRKAAKNGVFLDRAEIERRGRTSMPELLRTVTGVIVKCRGALCSVRMSRSNSATCPVQYFLNGIPVDSTTMNFAVPSEFEGIEIYRGPAELPPELNHRTAACGAVVMWTRIR